VNEEALLANRGLSRQKQRNKPSLQVFHPSALFTGTSKVVRPMSTATDQVYMSIHKYLPVYDLGGILIARY